MAKSKLDSPKFKQKLKKIRLLCLDVDGVLTDGRIFWVKGQGWTRHYHVRDGYGILLLKRAGLEVALLSAGESEELRERIQHLKLDLSQIGSEDKVTAIKKIKAEQGYKSEQIAYMGDELFDVPVFKEVGFSATVPEAVEEVKRRAEYVTQKPGGAGAVREVIDAIRRAQNLGPKL